MLRRARGRPLLLFKRQVLTPISHGYLRKPAFLLGLFFSAVVTVVLGFDVHAYNRVAACKYAQKYWDKVCSDGYFFEKTYPATYLGAATSVPSAFGHDCAHFVSCCIGNEPDEPGGGLELPSRTQAYGEPGAAKLVTWLLQHGAVSKGAVLDLQPGDVIAYDRTGDGSIDHVALYLGNNNVAAHSQSWYGNWRLIYGSGFKFIHITTAEGTTLAPSILRVAIGSDVSTVIEQSWPPAFRDVTLWTAGWLWTLSDAVGLEAGVAVVDLKNKRLHSPFSYFLGAVLQPLQILDSRVGGRLGFVHTPEHNWLAPYFGGEVSRRTFENNTISVSIGVEWVESGGSSVGSWCIWSSVCTYWTWSL